MNISLYAIPGIERMTRHEKADAIKEKVSKVADIPVSDIMSRKRNDDTVLVRQISIFLVWELANVSKVRAGKMHSRNHATVIHAIRRIQNEWHQDSRIPYIVEEVRKEFL